MYVEHGWRPELGQFCNDGECFGGRHVDRLGGSDGQQPYVEPDAQRHRCADAFVRAADPDGPDRAGSSRPGGS